MKQVIYRLKYWYHFLKTGILKGAVASFKYKHPAKKLKIIAITGTDGKTSSASLLYHILQTSGKKVALLSTVAAYIGDKKIETGFHVTSPNADALQKFMARMVKEEMEYLVLEFTSHGAYQHRLWGIKPLITGVTNVTHEHLDYHLNFKNYLEAKAMIIKKSATVILNEDDSSLLKIKRHLGPKNKVITYGKNQPLTKKNREATVKRFLEPYNQMNTRLITKISLELGLQPEEIAQGIKTFPGVEGRMQFIKNKRDITVAIDFAHTPNALDKALIALKKHMKAKKITGKLIAVYGSAGLRDAEKRPMMGKIGLQHADLVVFTAEDPRTEDVWSIIRQMKEQLETGHNRIVSIADREKAIDFAINNLAKKGDVVGIFGKGPEKSMCYGTVEYPWSEEAVATEALTKNKKK
ncbi:MAG: UDP-N-acetylmuramyl-tripeptide synthetase [Candidatus Pacebacteria bacterium]|nr:UDP-N-acetylmuramyl-tripeptide synthetase [Candidatus Paceibacterota bacterium]MBT4652119.1 UDP-N-acetylmuramyl-tripeptide synthetase [Candidatus Paceibacterota bacterium]MBT6756550.1 UDP-N-acetylmuramyl-tripeptide synthetase [Candidatus Paceibacterota bacterium]MBT6921375.1 UDP-N-acetylmuramyl-tripeptide synthetase [Candidatus Paceibacterota bacterium]